MSANDNSGFFNLRLRTKQGSTFGALYWGHDGYRERLTGTWRVEGNSIVFAPEATEHENGHVAGSHRIYHEFLRDYQLVGFAEWGPLMLVPCDARFEEEYMKTK